MNKVLHFESEVIKHKKAQTDLKQAEKNLKNVSDLFTLAERVLSCTYVDELRAQEEYRRASEHLGNGTFSSDAEEYRVWDVNS